MNLDRALKHGEKQKSPFLYKDIPEFFSGMIARVDDFYRKSDPIESEGNLS